MTEMTKQYKVAAGWKVFILIATPIACCVFGWVAYTTVIAEPFKIAVALFAVPLCIAMMLLFILGTIELFKSTLTFTTDGIRKVNLLGTKELAYNEIKGIKSDENYVYILPKDDSRKPIKVSQYFGKKSEWHDLLLSKFPDLDVEAIAEEQKKLFEDETYGRTQEERDDNITQTKRITKYLNYASWAACVWLWFYPHPYVLATIVGMVLPIIGLFLVFRSKGLIKVMGIKNSAYPSLATTLAVPPLAIMIRVLYDYDILEYQNVWVYTFVATPVLVLMLIRATKREFQAKSKLEGISIYPFWTLTIGLFIFFASIMVNCTFDESTPEVHEATVVDMKISKGGRRAPRYLLTISPWGKVTEESEVGVSKSQYESLQEGSKVNVNLSSGLLEIPWIYVTTQ